LSLEFGLYITLIGIITVFASLAIIALTSIVLKKIFKSEIPEKSRTAEQLLPERTEKEIREESERTAFKVKIDNEEYEVKIEDQDFSGEAAEKGLPTEPSEKQETSAYEKKPNKRGKETVTAPTFEKAVAEAETAIEAPVHGKVVKINVALGMKVEKGTVLAVLETMKMENDIESPVSGVVKEIRFSEGDIVSAGDVLMLIG